LTRLSQDIARLVTIKSPTELVACPAVRLPDEKGRKWLRNNTRVVLEVEADKLHGYTPPEETEEEIIRVSLLKSTSFAAKWLTKR